MTRQVESLQIALAEAPILHWFATTASWRIAFLLSGALGVVWCIAFYRWFRDDPAQKPSVSSAELRHIEQGRGVPEADHHMGREMWGALFSSASLWAMALYYVFGSFGWSFFVSWMPRYLKVAHGVTFEESEWSSAWPLVCGGIACLVGGVLSDTMVKRTGWRRVGRAVFPVAGCLAAALAMFAIPQVATQRDATILMCVAAAAFDFGQAANWAAIVDMGGRYAGVALGFINMVGNLGNSAQPYVGARVFDALGWNALFVVYGVAFLLAMTTWLVINPTRCFYDGRTPKAVKQ
jgi:ACS family glucarate transporter-like MFS transporter